MKLLKIAAAGCPVCDSLAEIDVNVAAGFGLEFECFELGDFAATSGSLRDYVIHYHVNPEDGSIDVPIYVIHDNGAAKGSRLVKDESDLLDLLTSWDRYNQSQSSDTKTE